MKKFYALLLLTLSGLFVMSNPVDVKLARKVAINYLNAKKGSSIDTFDLKLINTHQVEGNDALYIFALSKGGFIIVSADDEAKPVIGWSLTNPMPKTIDNPVVLGRMEWYAKQVRYAAKSKLGDKSTKQEWQDIIDGNIAKGNKAAGPLLSTLWNQEPYYNNLCPQNTPVGCVATAMSQIMRYHQWPQNGIGWHKYEHATYGTQYAHFEETTYSWSSMPIQLTSNSTNDEILAVATLCYHAGVSVNMNYDPDGSGAFSRDVLYALTNYFNYDPTTIQIHTFDSTNQTNWINMIKAEIDAGRPVYYAGNSKASGGHAWVCDGYNDYNELHINWGWGGYANGYYAATAMNPTGTSYDFSESNEMITGIKPNQSPYKHLWVQQASGFNTPSRGIQYISAVSNMVTWAVAYDGSGSSANVKEYTMTTDGGATWKAGSINPSNSTGFAAAMISAIDDKTAWVPLYDGTNGGGMIARTTDGGKTWTQQATATFSKPYGFPNVVHFWDANNGFCMGDPNGGYFEIYTTIDGGTTWTRVSASNIPDPLTGEYGVVGYYDVIGDTVWFATNKGRIYKSTNKGANWQAYKTPFTTTAFTIAFKNGNEGIVYGNENDVDKYYRTSNGGASWTGFTPTGNVYTADFCWIPGTDTLISTGSNYSANKMGVSYSIDGGNTFTDYAPFYKNFQFTEIGASPNGTVWAGGFNSNSTYGGMWRKGAAGISGYFNINKTTGYRNDSTVVFTDKSYGLPDSWEWNFGEGAEPATLSTKGPHTVKYTSIGDKTVTLTVQKGNDIHVYIKEKSISITWPAGVEPNENDTKLSIYPNPTSSSLTVKINGFTKGKIDVYTITGALVWSSGTETTDGQIDVSGLHTGIYLVKIKGDDGTTATRKLTVTR